MADGNGVMVQPEMTWQSWTHMNDDDVDLDSIDIDNS